MSTSIDKRVVEMRFDNKQFEKNVSTTMSTLDKLKEKLNFKGAAKGLEDVGKSAQKVDLSGISSAAQTVGLKFNAMYSIADQALRNITNSAMRAGKNIVNALTIQPVTTGFNEYELKMNSIQTIMASTGEELSTVNQYLNELNEYSDKTIYSFSDMTQNIGKFTNAGVKLEDAVLAMKGISNEAALSGANANEASRAMYNFAQALSVGYIQRIDWKSIELANMATMEFKEQLLTAAIEMGTVKKNADGMYASIANPDKWYNASAMFTETLDDQWLTTEVLIGTLKDYADETTEIGGRATKAATEVKTFTQMMDALKESAQSGWARTWEIIFGDFYEGKELWTGMYNAIDKVLGAMSDARNNLLDKVFSSKWEKLSAQIEKAGFSADDYLSKIKDVAKENGIAIEDLEKEYGSLAKAITKGKIPANILTKALNKLLGAEESLEESTSGVTKSLEECKKIVDKVLIGEFGNGEKRVKALTEAGYDYATVQNLVNEKLGISYRHVSKLTEEQKKNATQLSKLSDEQLKQLKYTDEQIEALRELQKAADKGGTSINALINSMTKPSGRELVIESFTNVCKYFSEVLGLVGDAWDNVFGDIDVGQGLYNIIEQFHEFTEAMTISEDTAKNFATIMEGAFAGLKLTGTIMSKSVVSMVKLLDAFLGLIGTDILEVAAAIANYIIAFEEWIEVNTMFGWDTMRTKVAEVLAAIYNGIKNCVDAFMNLEVVQKTIQRFKDALSGLFGTDFSFGLFSFESILGYINNFFKTLENWIKSFDSKSWEQIGGDIIDGLLKGLGKGWEVIVKIYNFAKDIIQTFRDAIDSNSPSKEFFKIGGDIILGLLNGLKKGMNMVIDAVLTLGQKVIDVIKTLDFGKIFAIITIFSIVKILKGISDSMAVLVGPIKGVNKVLGGLSNVCDSIVKRNKAKTIRDVAISIAILVASVVALAYLIGNKKMSTNLWQAVAIIGALAGILYLLASATNKMSEASATIDKGGVSIQGLKQSLMSIGAAILLMAVAVRLIGTMDFWQAAQGFAGLIVLLGAAIGVLTMFALFTKMGANFSGAARAGKMITSIAVSMLLMIAVIKLASKLSPEEAQAGVGAMIVFGTFVAAIVMVMSMIAGKSLPKVATTLNGIMISMLLMVAVIKLVALLKPDEIRKGITFMIAFGVFTTFIVLLLDSVEKELPKIAGTLMALSTSMLLLVLVTKLVGTLKPEDIINGVTFGALFLIFAKFLIQVINTIEKDAPKIAGALLSLSVAVGVLALIAVLLSTIDPTELAKGVVAVSVLSFFMSLMVKALQGANDVKGSLIVLTIAVGVMAAAVAALSFIKPEDLFPAVAAMTLLMAMFKLLMDSAKNIQGSLVTIGVLALVVAGLAVILWALQGLPVESTLANAVAISTLLLTMSGVLAILSAIGPKAALADAAMIALAKLVGGVALVIAALGALSQIPGFKTIIEDGGEALALIGYAIGKFVGSIIGGFSAGATSGLPEIGANLGKFMENLGGFVDGVKDLKEVGNFDILENLGDAVKDYSKSVSKVDFEDVLESSNVLKHIAVAINQLGKVDMRHIGVFAEAINAISNIDFEGIKSSEAKKFYRLAAEFMSQFVKGTGDSEAKVDMAIDKVMNSAEYSASDNTDSFYDVGKNIVLGLVNGISANRWRAEAEAAAMAKAAYNAAKVELDINSPSKIFRSLGYSVPEGFAMGIDKMSNLASRSAVGMADTAINSVRNSIALIADAVNTDIDSQPTIRPVLDLSNIRSGAGSISDLLGVGTSVGVLANVGAISSAMSGYGQNGGNTDVVSAINKLRKDLGKVGNTTYQVNGVTYDDGTNVSTAVEELVRAARIERRV